MSDSALHALAGAIGGMVAMSATYPLVVLSTRAAVDTSKSDDKAFTQVVLDIIKHEGIHGLYSGLSSSLIGIAVTNGVYYYFYERSRGLILNSRAGSKALSTLESMLAGLIAGSATTLINNPFWVVQTSQAVHRPSADASSAHRRKLGALEAIDVILAKDGPAGFWRGIGPALVLVINPVIQYTVFEQLKNALIRARLAAAARGTAASRPRGSAASTLLSDWDFFVLGAVSKLVATGTTYPYIVVKSRLQAGHERAKRYKSALQGLLTIFKEEGLQGLYGGAASKLVQSVLTAAILFAAQKRIYEFTSKVVLSLKKAQV